MDKVITINNWWDGALLGLAYFENSVCIYERIFDDVKDDWTDEYYLTPVSENEFSQIMADWAEWCHAVGVGDCDSYYQKHLHDSPINLILENSDSKRKYQKKAVFKGTFGDGYIPIDYYAQWND